MDTELGGGLAGLGLILLMLRFGEGLLPSFIRIIGNILVIGGILSMGKTWGIALLIGGILAVASSVWTIKKNDWEVVMCDGIVLAVGIVEAILGLIVGI